jgi:L-iditol 2-dehydrogenase
MCLAGRHNLCENRQLIGMHRPGAYAEYLVAPEVNLVRLPDALSDDHAALAEPLAVCIHAVGLAHIMPHDSAIVVGAGAIGLITIALLRRAGVGMLIASDVHPARLEAAQRLGATHTVRADEQDTAAAVRDLTGGRGVDLAFEAVGTDATVAAALASVRNQGQVVWIGNNKRHITLDMQAVVTRELRVQGTYGMTPADFERATVMLADGAIPADALIRRRAPLAHSAGLFDELLGAPEVIKCLIIP